MFIPWWLIILIIVSIIIFGSRGGAGTEDLEDRISELEEELDELKTGDYSDYDYTYNRDEEDLI